MYLQHFGLLRAPFEMTPDPAFLYLGESHQEGLATLVYGVRARKGFVMLTGEVGTGKTTLLHALLSQLDPKTAAAFVFNPRLGPLDFFRVLFDEFDIQTPCTTKAEYLIAFNKFLIDRLERDHPTLLIVDEAQNLSAEMLEEIRLLSNLETPHSKLIQIMLVGTARAGGDAAAAGAAAAPPAHRAALPAAALRRRRDGALRAGAAAPGGLHRARASSSAARSGVCIT